MFYGSYPPLQFLHPAALHYWRHIVCSSVNICKKSVGYEDDHWMDLIVVYGFLLSPVAFLSKFCGDSHGGSSFLLCMILGFSLSHMFQSSFWLGMFVNRLSLLSKTR